MGYGNQRFDSGKAFRLASAITIGAGLIIISAWAFGLPLPTQRALSMEVAPASAPLDSAQITITVDSLDPAVLTAALGTEVTRYNATATTHTLQSGEPYRIFLPAALHTLRVAVYVTSGAESDKLAALMRAVDSMGFEVYGIGRSDIDQCRLIRSNFEMDSGDEPSVEPDSSNSAAVLCPSCGRPMQRRPIRLGEQRPRGRCPP